MSLIPYYSLPMLASSQCPQWPAPNVPTRPFTYSPLGPLSSKCLSVTQCPLHGPSDCHRGVLLLTGDTGHTGWRGEGGLEGSVAPLGGIQVGLRWGDGVGIADVLGVEKLSLVRHNLGGLLTVEDRKIGGHVDEDAGVRGEAT